MKKIIIGITFLCFLSLFAHAQFQLGQEEAEVIKHANDDGITKITKTYSEDGTKVLTWKNEMEKATFILGFDLYGYSTMMIIMPYTNKDLDGWIVTLSKHATRQNKQLWTAKIKGNFYTIKLQKFTPPDKLAFVIEQVKPENN